MPARWTFALGVSVLCLPLFADAADWPQFRGPGNSGVATDTPFPDDWSATKNVTWKVKVPGYGWSSPVVWGDKVFVTTAVSDKQKKPSAGFGGFGGGFPKKGGFPKMKGGFPKKGGFGGGLGKAPDAVYRFEVHCLDRATGETLWKKVADEHKPTTPINPSNTYATETPVTDGERVYAYFGMNGVYCYDFAGNRVWKKDLGAYPTMFGHGSGASPALAAGRLFVQCDNERKSFLVALDAKTGDECWRVERDEKSTWSTPFIWKTRDRTEVVCSGNTIRSHDPATGKLLWELGGVQGQYCATPVADEERLYVGTGGMFGRRPLLAVRAGASGDITLKAGETSNAGVAWSRTQAGPGMASPLLYRGYLYVADQNGGYLNCYDARTGKPAYTRKRLDGAKGFTASPWAQGDAIYCLDEDGTTLKVRAGPQFEELGSSGVEEMCWASPAVSRGALFLRGVEHLYCISRASPGR
jgi:outer membrane protein assembly factor BamB